MRNLLLFFLSSTFVNFSLSQKSSQFVQFRRQAFDKSKYPPPNQSPARSTLPQEWIDTLESLEKAGKIPNIPPTSDPQGGIKYPDGFNANSAEVCNWSVNNCFGQNDVRNVSNGVWTISFDDGPTFSSTELYDFLHSHNQPGTHFMIGSQILIYPEIAKHALETQQQLALHTWSHHLQTTKTNVEIVGDLGWNIQIVYDISGRIPNIWRPPQGNVDNRVRAIAEQVFNLTTIMWTDDCNDWCIGEQGQSYCPNENPGKSQESVQRYIQKTLQKPKSPGIILLEHELNKNTIGYFKSYFPTLSSLGWTPKNIPDSLGLHWYSNAVSNDDKAIPSNSILPQDVKAAVAKTNTTSSITTTKGSNSTKPILSKSSAVKLPIHQALFSFAPIIMATLMILMFCL